MNTARLLAIFVAFLTLAAVRAATPKTVTADSTSAELLWPTNFFSANSNLIVTAGGVVPIERGGSGQATAALARTAWGLDQGSPGATGTNLLVAATPGAARVILGLDSGAPGEVGTNLLVSATGAAARSILGFDQADPGAFGTNLVVLATAAEARVLLGLDAGAPTSIGTNMLTVASVAAAQSLIDAVARSSGSATNLSVYVSGKGSGSDFELRGPTWTNYWSWSYNNDGSYMWPKISGHGGAQVAVTNISDYDVLNWGTAYRHMPPVLASISDLQLFAGSAPAAFVSDTNRGGLFMASTDALTHDGGVVFTNTGMSRVWKRVFDGPAIFSWWGPSENGASACDSLLTSAIQCASGLVDKELVISGTLFLTNAVDFSGVTLRCNPGTVITNINTNSFAFTASGSIGSYQTLSADAQSGATNVECSAIPSGLVVGDFVKVKSSKRINELYIGELKKVFAIDGTVVCFTEPLYDNYLVSDSAGIAKVTTTKANLIGWPKVVGPTEAFGGLQYTNASCVSLYAVSDGLVQVRAENFSTIGVSVSDCWNTLVDRCDVDGASRAGYGYGVIVADASTHTMVIGGTIANARHATTVGGTLPKYGIVTDTKFFGISGSCGENIASSVVFDTHGAARDVVFDSCSAFVSKDGIGFDSDAPVVSVINCKVYGGNTALQNNAGTRAPSTLIVKNLTHFYPQSDGSVSQGVYLAGSITNLVIDGVTAFVKDTPYTSGDNSTNYYGVVIADINTGSSTSHLSIKGINQYGGKVALYINASSGRLPGNLVVSDISFKTNSASHFTTAPIFVYANGASSYKLTNIVVRGLTTDARYAVYDNVGGISYTISDAVINVPRYGMYFAAAQGSVTLNNCLFYTVASGGAAYVLYPYYATGGRLTANNCKFVGFTEFTTTALEDVLTINTSVSSLSLKHIEAPTLLIRSNIVCFTGSSPVLGANQSGLFGTDFAGTSVLWVKDEDGSYGPISKSFILDTPATASNTAGATNTLLWGCSIPSDALKANGESVTFMAHGSFGANTEIKVLYVDFNNNTNDVTVLHDEDAWNATGWECEGLLTRLTSTNAYLTVRFVTTDALGIAPIGVLETAGTIWCGFGSVSHNINVRGGSTNSASNVIIKGGVSEWKPAK